MGIRFRLGSAVFRKLACLVVNAVASLSVVEKRSFTFRVMAVCRTRRNTELGYGGNQWEVSIFFQFASPGVSESVVGGKDSSHLLVGRAPKHVVHDLFRAHHSGIVVQEELEELQRRDQGQWSNSAYLAWLLEDSS